MNTPMEIAARLRVIVDVAILLREQTMSAATDCGKNNFVRQTARQAIKAMSSSITYLQNTISMLEDKDIESIHEGDLK